MKFLVTAMPIAPVTDKTVLEKLAVWMREQRDAGRLESAYGLVGGGGCSIMEAESLEDLHDLTGMCPIGPYLSFDIKPLIDLEHTLDRGLSNLP